MDNSRVDGMSMSRGLKLSHICSFVEVIYLNSLHIITRTCTTWSPTVRDQTESSTGQGGIKCTNRRTGFIDNEGSHR